MLNKKSSRAWGIFQVIPVASMTFLLIHISYSCGEEEGLLNELCIIDYITFVEGFSQHSLLLPQLSNAYCHRLDLVYVTFPFWITHLVCTKNFPKNLHSLPSGTHAYLCVSLRKKFCVRTEWMIHTGWEEYRQFTKSEYITAATFSCLYFFHLCCTSYQDSHVSSFILLDILHIGGFTSHFQPLSNFLKIYLVRNLIIW